MNELTGYEVFYCILPSNNELGRVRSGNENRRGHFLNNVRRVGVEYSHFLMKELIGYGRLLNTLVYSS